jgi:carbon starvation protein CstA
MNPGLLVERMCSDWLGNAGLVLAVLGIVAAPMSTGGGAFRAARMMVADFSHYDQKPLLNRLILTAPLFAVAIAMLNVSSFKVLWLYVSWFNQVLATFTFYTIAHYLRFRTDGRGILPRWSWLIAYFPAVFMCAVSACFILIDKENGFGMNTTMGYFIGGVFTAVIAVWFVVRKKK